MVVDPLIEPGNVDTYNREPYVSLPDEFLIAPRSVRARDVRSGVPHR